MLNHNPNRLRTSAAALVAALSGIALNSCAASPENNTVPEPACAIHIKPGDTLYDIAATSDMDIRKAISEIEQINSDIDAGHLNTGDDVEISSRMCQDIIANKKSTLDLRLLLDNPNPNQ